jgi:hypothetical protein
MFTKTALLAALAALSAALVIKRSDQQVWAADGGKGNLQISVSDTSINWGTTTPWSALDTLNQHCSGKFSIPSLCVPIILFEGPLARYLSRNDLHERTRTLHADRRLPDFGCDETWDLPTGWVSNGEAADGTITIKVLDATFPKGKLGAGIEVLKSASANAHSVTQETYNSDPCYTTSCQTTATNEQKTIDQHHAPGHYSLRVDDEDQDLKATVNLEIKVTMEDEVAGACEDLVNAVGAVAGAVSGSLGAAFTLGALFCKS